MDEQELLKERFKSAVSSTVKAISENFDLEIKFGSSISSKENSLSLPEVANLKKLQDFTNLRAFADSEALKIRYTDVKTYLKNEPKGATSKSLYAIAEKIRYEKIGSDRLKGVKNNIIQCYENKFKDKKIEEIKTESDVPITEAFELYLRSHFFKLKQNQTTKKVLSYWKDLFDKNLKQRLKELDSCVDNQSKFNKLVADLIENLDFEDSNSEEKEQEKETKEDPSQGNSNNQDNDSSQKKDDQSDNSDLSVAENSLESSDEDDASTQEELEGDTSLLKNNQKKLFDEKYKIFTNKYDEIKNAEDLENNEEMTRLRKNLDQQLTNLQTLVAKLANKLQRKLLAKQNRSWEFDLEEGMLDASKLSRIIIDPFHSLSYKMEKEVDFKDTVVTLQWNVENKPKNPGRLNDLRHIVYKSADKPWRQSKKNLGLMLKEGLLKENIDGEALLWAFKRIAIRKEERKILMVISDGAPVDDSTLSVNSGDYLEKHLKQTVKWIEENSNIEILAVGIGHDVTRYYKKAIKIADVQELGDVMINQLTKLFSTKNKKTIH